MSGNERHFPKTTAMRSLGRRLAAEAVGTAFLLMAVVGSGIMAQRLSPGDVGLQLFENAVATAFALMALIWAFGPISGAHFNPGGDAGRRGFAGPGRFEKASPTWGRRWSAGLPARCWRTMMFALPPVAWSTKERSGPDLWLAEVIATLGLLLVIFLIPQRRGVVIPVAVGAYIGAAYFFTSSTSFANPAGYGGADVFGHVRRHTAGFRAAVHRDATGRGGAGNWAGVVPGGTAAGLVFHRWTG